MELPRDFRDKVLSRTTEGRELIELYYEWSPMMVKMLEEDRRLREEVKKVMDGVILMLRNEMWDEN